MSKDRREVIKKGYQGGTLQAVEIERKPNVSDPRGGSSDERNYQGGKLGSPQPPVVPNSTKK